MNIDDFKKMGEYLGLMYQIMDDSNDIETDEKHKNIKEVGFFAQALNFDNTLIQQKYVSLINNKYKYIKIAIMKIHLY